MGAWNFPKQNQAENESWRPQEPITAAWLPCLLRDGKGCYELDERVGQVDSLILIVWTDAKTWKIQNYGSMHNPNKDQRQTENKVKGVLERNTVGYRAVWRHCHKAQHKLFLRVRLVFRPHFRKRACKRPKCPVEAPMLRDQKHRTLFFNGKVATFNSSLVGAVPLMPELFFSFLPRGFYTNILRNFLSLFACTAPWMHRSPSVAASYGQAI